MAAAAEERRIRLLEDPPDHRIKQAHGAAEYLHAVRPLAGTFIGPGAKIGQMAEDVRRPRRQILSHGSHHASGPQAHRHWLPASRGRTHIVPGFHAQPGYDLISGLGTIDAAQFVPELTKAAG